MKTLEEMVLESQNEIPRKSLNEVKSVNAFVIDVRQLEEVNATQLIDNAVHIPRGKLEFAISNLENISKDSIFTCIVQLALDPLWQDQP